MQDHLISHKFLHECKMYQHHAVLKACYLYSTVLIIIYNIHDWKIFAYFTHKCVLQKHRTVIFKSVYNSTKKFLFEWVSFFQDNSPDKQLFLISSFSKNTNEFKGTRSVNLRTKQKRYFKN